jgi:hypothetical protein
MTNIRKETIDKPLKNRVVIVGATAVPVNPFKFRFMKGIVLYAPGSNDPVPNTAPIWIGNVNVTADLEIETGGFPLVPGSQITLPVEYLTKLHAISTAADQHLLWIGV